MDVISEILHPLTINETPTVCPVDIVVKMPILLPPHEGQLSDRFAVSTCDVITFYCARA